MKKDAYISVLVSESVKQAFQEALERDPRQLTQSQMIRHWIERYVASAQDQGNSDYAELKQQIAELKAEVEMQMALKDQLFKLVESRVDHKYDKSEEVK